MNNIFDFYDIWFLIQCKKKYSMTSGIIRYNKTKN